VAYLQTKMIELALLTIIVSAGFLAVAKLSEMAQNARWRKWNDDCRFGYAPDGKDSFGLTRKSRNFDKP
jgi:hypothetical protein